MFSYYVQKDFAHLAGAGSYYVSLLILDGINPALDTERENHWLAIHLHVSSDCDRCADGYHLYDMGQVCGRSSGKQLLPIKVVLPPHL